jgi:hypothetical protein
MCFANMRVSVHMYVFCEYASKCAHVCVLRIPASKRAYVHVLRIPECSLRLRARPHQEDVQLLETWDCVVTS